MDIMKPRNHIKCIFVLLYEGVFLFKFFAQIIIKNIGFPQPVKVVKF